MSVYCVLLLLGVVINSSTTGINTRVARRSVPGTGWPSYYASDFTAAYPIQKKEVKTAIPDYKVLLEWYNKQQKKNYGDSDYYWGRGNNYWGRWDNRGNNEMPSGWSKYYNNENQYGSHYPSYTQYYPEVSGWDYNQQHNSYYDWARTIDVKTNPNYIVAATAVKQVNPDIIGRDGRRTETQPLSGNTVAAPLTTITTDKQQVSPTKSLCPQNDYDGIKRFAYHKAHEKCYEIGSQGPCKTNMRFYLEETGSNYGSCDCDAKVGYTCGRPLVYWEKHEWCYPINSQGPCLENEWFVLNAKGQPVCEPNTCIFEQRRDFSRDSDCEHWISVKGQCFQTSTQGYCQNYDELLYWDIFDSRSIAPICTKTKFIPDFNNPQTNPISKVDRTLPCFPGQKQTMLGKCLPYYRNKTQ